MKVKRQLALIKQTRTRALNCRAFVVTALVIYALFTTVVQAEQVA
jgi:hypothetical protein